MKRQTLEQNIKDVRRAGAPLVLITTADPSQTIKTVISAMNGATEDIGLLQHDVIRGLQGVRGSQNGQALAAQCGEETRNPVECLFALYSNAVSNPEQWRKALIFMMNSQGYLSGESMQPVQAVWNLRDVFETIGATLVLMSCTGRVPDELRQDVIVIEDPLPTPAELLTIAKPLAEQAAKAGANIDPEAIAKDQRLGDTLTGTSAFGAKQVFSMALRKKGLDLDVLGERKRKLVEQTKGLSVWEGGETFEQLGGLSNLKQFLTAMLTSGKTPVRAIGFLDEIEKMMSGATGAGESSGTSADQLQVFLREMQDNNTAGIILLGPPGTGKSAIAKASGRIAQCPVLNFDLGAAKGSLVGESEGRIRAMMSVFQAVSQGKGLFIATCNAINSLPPELRRRFKMGTFFVDLPTAEERKVIWEIWRKRFELGKQALPNDADWSGAEISACCEVAFRTGKTLKEASSFVVPIAKSAPEKVQGLRRMASGRFLSASNEGFYQYQEAAASQAAPEGRQITLE